MFTHSCTASGPHGPDWVGQGAVFIIVLKDEALRSAQCTSCTVFLGSPASFLGMRGRSGLPSSIAHSL